MGKTLSTGCEGCRTELSPTEIQDKLTMVHMKEEDEPYPHSVNTEADPYECAKEPAVLD